MEKLLNEADLVEWIKRRLGHPALKVPLSLEQFSDALAAAKHWFAAKKGIDKCIVIPTFCSQVEYQMPYDVDAVIDVSFTSNKLDLSLIFDPWAFAGEQVPYNVFAPPAAGAGGMYSTFTQVVQYLKMAKNIMSIDHKWEYRQYSKILWMSPAIDGHAIIEYKSNIIQSIDQLPERDHDLIKRFALAWSKRDLGSIYSRYASWPGGQGQIVLNGPQLIAESAQEFLALEDEISNSALPMPILMG